MLMSSCVREQEDLFGESSALRLEHAVENYNDLLCSATNGWVMQYFATPAECGYPLLVKFEKSGGVTVGAKNEYSSNDVYDEKSSLFEVIADNGPVLTFNSYNPLLHIFSSPEDIPGTSEDESGLGHEGDYEFVLYSVSEDKNTIHMKGKKGNLNIYLYRLPETQGWEDYFTQLETAQTEMFDSRIDTLFMTTDKGNFTVTGMSTGMFSFVPEGGDAVTETTTIGGISILTPNEKVALSVPFTGTNNQFSIQNFELSEEGILVCTDENGANARISAGGEANMFSTRTYKWRMDKSSLSGAFVEAYDNVASATKEYFKKNKFNVDFQYFEFQYDSSVEKYALSYRVSGGLIALSGSIYLDVTTEGNTVTFTYNGEANSQAVALMNELKEYETFVDLLTSTKFTMKGNSPLSMTAISMQSVEDVSNSFIVNLQ